MNLTESQKSAIDIRDSSLIISAGAGSGKTAVLTQRILERICDENDDCTISDFLIVTFTNAAAKELSDRMRKKLSEKAVQCPNNKKISTNIALLPLAKISTINSFCYELVRNNFHKLSLSANVRIGDEAEMGVVRSKLMNEVVDEAFDNGDDTMFFTAYEIFSGAKNDEGFVETLLNLDNTFSNLPDPKAFCKKVLEDYEKAYTCNEFFDCPLGIELYRKTKQFFTDTGKAFEKLIKVCSENETLTAKYLPAIDEEYSFTRKVLCALEGGYDKVRELLCDYRPKSLGAVRGGCDALVKDSVKNSKSELCSAIKDFCGDFYNCDSSVLKNAAKDTYNVLGCLFRLVDRFREKLDAQKKKMGIIEFSDAERYTLQLLVESVEPFRVTPLAESLRDKFKEIYIDEYQDVNPLQDLIFKAISRVDESGCEYTRFMVGDVKQSIYRFRGASPGIFMGYRDSFCDIDSQSRRKRIFMNHNFRCSRSVIDLSNYLFKKLMSDYYMEGDELVFARHEENKVDTKALLLLSEYDKEVAGRSVSADELEAAMICGKIRQIIGNPMYRNSDGKTYGYNDIAVLARSKSALKTYERVFSEKGIPVFSDVGESFYGKREVMLCLSILRTIDNPMRDIPLAGFMRSFAGRFTDDELCIIKAQFKGVKLYNAVKKYGENSEGKCNEALSEKCRTFVEMLREYRNFSRGKSASELMWKLYTGMGLLDYCVSEGFTSDGKSARRNLLKLYEIALDFNKTSFRGLGAFVDYINSSMEKDDIKAERILGTECVRLMTIHASKGLEFPVCFVSDTARRFNKTDERQHLVFSQNLGLASVLCDTEEISSTDSESSSIRITTPYRKLIASEIDAESMKEEIRILYVALTRARDMLIISGVSSKKPSKLINEALTTQMLGNFDGTGNFLAMILSCLIREKAMLPLYLASDVQSPEIMSDALSGCLDCEFISCERALSLLNEALQEDVPSEDQGNEEVDSGLYDEISRLSGFEYRGKTHLPAKLTVSMLKKGLIDDEMSDLDGGEKVEAETHKVSLENRIQKKIPDFLAGEKTADGAEKGTAMHLFMQFARYESCEEAEDCKAEAGRLCDMGFITEQQKELLDFEKLQDFFHGSLYSKIKASDTVYREQRFNLEVSDFDSKAFLSQEGEILVQGVIDLFYKNADGTYSVVDFKTDRVFGAHAEQTLIDRHKTQLSYYCRAVSEMTSCRVRDAYLYSFALSKAVRVEI